jgi:laccase
VYYFRLRAGISRFEVRRGSTYLLRIINAALNTQFFFKVAGHTFTVVAADASYTTRYQTDVIVIAPGQTVDALMAADASPGCYYMAISSYQSAIPLRPGSFNGNITTAVVEYVGASTRQNQQQQAPPALPAMPELTDTRTANRFYTGLTALVRPGMPTVPLAVDTRMFVTVGMGFSSCKPAQTACNRSAAVVAASMNNQSFALPTTLSLLDARYRNTPGGVYTADFPDRPPVAFDYANVTGRQLVGAAAAALSSAGSPTTKVKAVGYNATVEMVLQNTALVGRESHPMHLHGFNFFVLAQGFGNYGDGAKAAERFNLVNPQERNTVAVPTGGWAVIRFVANNPGKSI